MVSQVFSVALAKLFSGMPREFGAAIIDVLLYIINVAKVAEFPFHHIDHGLNH
jgi:hypothetical protein